MKGAFEEVVRHCTKYNNGGIALPMTPQQRAFCQQAEKRMGSLGLRGQCLRPGPGFGLHVPLTSRGPRSVRGCQSGSRQLPMKVKQEWNV